MSSPRREGIIFRTRRGSFHSQIRTTPIPRFSYQHRIINTPESKSLREKESQPFKISCEDDLFDADFGNSLNFWFHKGPSSDYNSNPLKKGSLRKCLYSHIGYWEEFKDGMSNDAIEGKSSPLEDTSILSSSMPTLEVLSKPFF
jgi:hypothetical protein